MAAITNAELAVQTQDHLNKYIAAADQKASILLTGQFAFLGLTATAVNDIIKTAESAFWVLSVGTAVSGVIAAFFAIVVIYPRTPSPEKGFIYWGNILSHGSPDKFQQEVNSLSDDEILKELSIQNYMLAKVADRKYDHLRWSLRFTIVMVSLASLAGMVFLA
jgi:hypothetical protein